MGPIGKHGPPFHGTTTIAPTITRVGGSASASFLVPPKFNLTTGFGHVSAKSAAKRCGPAGLHDLGQTNATVGFDSTPFTWSSPGPVPANFTINFTVRFVTDLSATLGAPAGGPSAWAYSAVLVPSYLYDPTAGTAATGGAYYFQETTNGSLTGIVNATWNYPVQATFSPPHIVSGDQDTVEFSAYAIELAYAPGHTSTSATALRNMGTGSEKFKVGFWELA